MKLCFSPYVILDRRSKPSPDRRGGARRTFPSPDSPLFPSPDSPLFPSPDSPLLPSPDAQRTRGSPDSPGSPEARLTGSDKLLIRRRPQMGLGGIRTSGSARTARRSRWSGQAWWSRVRRALSVGSTPTLCASAAVKSLQRRRSCELGAFAISLPAFSSGSFGFAVFFAGKKIRHSTSGSARTAPRSRRSSRVLSSSPADFRHSAGPGTHAGSSVREPRGKHAGTRRGPPWASAGGSPPSR